MALEEVAFNIIGRGGEAGSIMSAEKYVGLLDQVVAETQKDISLSSECWSLLIEEKIHRSHQLPAKSPNYLRSLLIPCSSRSNTSSVPILPRLQLREPFDGQGDPDRCSPWSLSKPGIKYSTEASRRVFYHCGRNGRYKFSADRSRKADDLEQ